MTLSGTLGIRNGQSDIDGQPLAVAGGNPNEFLAATAMVRGAGFRSGDPLSADGQSGTVGNVAVFFITSVGRPLATAAVATKAAAKRATGGGAAKRRGVSKKSPAKKSPARTGAVKTGAAKKRSAKKR